MDRAAIDDLCAKVEEVLGLPEETVGLYGDRLAIPAEAVAALLALAEKGA